jgi:pyruvate formate lyase activating enzyme
MPARLMGADRIFFSGGEATIHLPYIEEVVKEARKIAPETRVNFDTNGYLTEESLRRVLSFATSITYDIKAFNDEVFLALTGASAPPVLRNAEYIARHAKDRLWEYRILVIPGINEQEIRPLTEFIADLDPDLPVCFLAFRPNFVLETHPGATRELMNRCAAMAKEAGLRNAYGTGHTDLPGRIMEPSVSLDDRYVSGEARLAASYALRAGCGTHPRGCAACEANQACPVKKYTPGIST